MEAISGEMEVSMNYDHFHDVVGALNLEALNVLQVCEAVYEAAFYRYGMKFHQEKLLREKCEKTIISKNVTLDAGRFRIAKLEALLEEAGIDIPKAGEEVAEALAQNVALHEGSTSTEGDT